MPNTRRKQRWLKALLKRRRREAEWQWFTDAVTQYMTSSVRNVADTKFAPAVPIAAFLGRR